MEDISQKIHCQLNGDTCLLTLRIVILVIERVLLGLFGYALLSRVYFVHSKKEKVKFVG